MISSLTPLSHLHLSTSEVIHRPGNSRCHTAAELYTSASRASSILSAIFPSVFRGSCRMRPTKPAAKTHSTTQTNSPPSTWCFTPAAKREAKIPGANARTPLVSDNARPFMVPRTAGEGQMLLIASCPAVKLIDTPAPTMATSGTSAQKGAIHFHLRNKFSSAGKGKVTTQPQLVRARRQNCAVGAASQARGRRLGAKLLEIFRRMPASRRLPWETSRSLPAPRA